MAVLNRLLRRSSWALSSYKLRSLFSSLNSGIDLGPNSLLNHEPLPLRRDPKARNVQWVFLGCPGVGKGTYASRLSNLLGVPHISTGDLLRDELSSQGPLSSEVPPWLYICCISLCFSVVLWCWIVCSFEFVRRFFVTLIGERFLLFRLDPAWGFWLSVT